MFEKIAGELKEAGVQLVAVSKTKSPDQILELYRKGQRVFGENKVQELVSKQEVLPSDIQWHLIGHLQTNKVKYIAPFAAMIQSVDSWKLLLEIDKQAAKCGRIIPCLLQFHIAEEETKFGLSLQEAEALLSSETFRGLKHVRIAGVMGMATFTDDEVQVGREFHRLREMFLFLKAHYFAEDPGFKEISMGMSSDYAIALKEGSTMARIGTLLFGPRS
ncbi:MAG: YggS family pyridoxal phosphate-dependent enzyme [Haliscomenobacter sp.]|nr:YggS family pyridoxal phosphate-dependent enzyme [Haliscomenobacter sp.]MBK8880623.1 YggS family pyridoxal phosphate-dependent enzyme [Haliscomenobacter sp.]